MDGYIDGDSAKDKRSHIYADSDDKPIYVIIAAGKATRLKGITGSKPKGLVEIYRGRAIMDLIIERIKRVGYRRIIIVTKKEYREALSKKYGDLADIVSVDVDEYENLYSVYYAIKTFDLTSFIVVMSDHLFEYRMLSKFVEEIKKEPAKNSHIVLAVDREPPRNYIGEGLKVDAINGKVMRVGKELDKFIGIDTGILYFNRDVSRIIIDEIDRKGPMVKIADIVNTVARRGGEVRYVDVTGMLWIDIDTPEDLNEARRLYIKILKKELIKSDDGVISRYLNRKISSSISTYLYVRNIYIDPTLITALSFSIAAIGGLLISFGNLIFGGILVKLASIIDGVDGELARLYGRETRFGGFIDSTLDRLSDFIILLGITVYLYPMLLHEIILAIFSIQGVVMVSYISHLLKNYGVSVARLRKIIPVTRDVRLFIVFISCILGVPGFSFLFIGIVSQIFILAGIIYGFYNLRYR